MTRFGSRAPLAGLAAVVTACAPVTSAPAPAPLNSCPAHPCEAYVGADGGTGPFGSPQCVSGACVLEPPSALPEGGASPTDDLVLLVTTSQTGFFFPGLTFALPWDVLRDQAAATSTGTTPGSASLPAAVQGSGVYLVTPSIARTVSDELGSPALDRSLPITATFEPLSISRPDGSTIGLGPLPVPTLSAASLVDRNTQGPFGAMGSSAKMNVPPATYRETWTPLAPFDQFFGPVIRVVTPSPNDSFFQGVVNFYDLTLDPTTSNLELPTYTISRQAGSFDGWTAYLRDVNTRQPVSNVVPLTGRIDPGVQFAVRRVPAGSDLGTPNPTADALDGVQVVVAPPTGSSEATGLFTPQGEPATLATSSLVYSTLPTPETVDGSVRALQGDVGTVDLVFEALAITRAGQLDAQDFEFTAWATAVPDGVTGMATFSVVLPPGEYRVDAHPRSGSSASAVVDLVVPVTSGGFDAPTIALGEPQPSVGIVQLADGRPLPGANVVGVPLACAPVPRSAPDTSWCLPRSVQTTSAPDGTFVLGLEPGTYRIHVEPPVNSRLPWVDARAAVVVHGADSIGAPPAGTLPVGTVVVPAPLPLGLRLTDSLGLRGVPGALVRAYRISGTGPTETAIELGEALTDDDGRYELYVVPPE
jgi:hypothetical protein